MWGKEKKIELPALALEEKRIEVPTKAQIGSGLSKEERSSYIRSALQIKLGSTPLLRIILEEGGFEIYPYEKVCDYLDSILGCSPGSSWDHHWGWRGLRLEDVEKPRRNYDIQDRDCLLIGPYQEEIPMPVLKTIEEVLNQAAPLEPRFYVSDVMREKDRNTRNSTTVDLDDPFLAVGTAGGNVIFVIERWDEPGFTLKGK
jgi:hypothetical protein